jgi:pimeloyl-ACP methyl ester carboxylesterase
MQGNEHWIEIDGGRIRACQAGEGPPLLLLPGLLGGSFCWRFTLPVLAQSYALHAVDLPGLAGSDEPDIDCSMSCQCDRLLRLIAQMNWNDLTVIGSSFGGAIAMLLAGKDVQASRRIRSLVLVSPVNPWSALGQRRIRWLNTTLGGLSLRAVLPVSGPCHGIAVRRMYADPRRVSQHTIEGYRATVLRRGRAQNILSALRNWRRDVDSLRHIIPQLKVPVLLVWGDQDRAVDPKSAAILQHHLPNSELRWIRQAGHLPFEEAPAEFNAAVLEFLHSSADR